MERIFCYVLVLFCLVSANAGIKAIHSDIDSIRELIKAGKFEEAQNLAIDLKSENDDTKDYLWLTKSNFLLGEINQNLGDYGKAIIYYLESIRVSEKADYDLVVGDRALIYNRCGIIFKKFNAYNLAEEYLQKGISLSPQHHNNILKLDLNYNLAGLFRDTKKYDEAIELLLDNIPRLDPESRRYFNYHNRLALTYRDNGEFLKAIEIHNKISTEVPRDSKKKGQYLHNIGKSYKAINDFDNAILFYSKAIDHKHLYDSEKSLFSSYFGLGETYFKRGEYLRAEHFLTMAEQLLPIQRNHPDYFEILKACANLQFQLKNYQKAKEYEDLYSERMIGYLDKQSELQGIDQSYNMDLITKRYFSDVKKQERISSILLYSQFTSGGLFALLLLVIGYFQFQKVRLRKSIEKELIALKFIEE